MEVKDIKISEKGSLALLHLLTNRDKVCEVLRSQGLECKTFPDHEFVIYVRKGIRYPQVRKLLGKIIKNSIESASCCYADDEVAKVVASLGDDTGTPERKKEKGKIWKELFDVLPAVGQLLQASAEKKRAEAEMLKSRLESGISSSQMSFREPSLEEPKKNTNWVLIVGIITAIAVIGVLIYIFVTKKES